MFSSSSSECEYEDYFKYACGLNSNDHEGYLPDSTLTPWYATMGQPLVYYAEAQCPPTKCQRRKKSHKGTNCFVKAFRWYTQEHVPKQKADSPDVSNFAAWLDAKYGEFLQNYPNCVSRIQIENTPSMEVNTASLDYAPCAPKRFSRLKSPWRKYKRASKEAGDVNNQTGPSFEIIMHPKDLACTPASDCCRPTEFRTPFHSKSTATLSSDTQYSRKLTTNSHSLTGSKENIHSVNALNKGSKTKQVQQTKATNSRVQTFEKPKKEEKVVCCDMQRTYNEQTIESQETACQCSEEIMKYRDAQIQYEKQKMKRKYSNYGINRQPYHKNESRTDVKNGVVFGSKFSQEEPWQVENDVSCQCSLDSIQYQRDFWDKYKQVQHTNQSHICVDKMRKHFNPDYRIRSDTLNLDVSCQCSEFNTRKMGNHRYQSRRTYHDSMHKQKRDVSRHRKKVVLRDVSCECFDEDILNIEYPGQYQYELGTFSGDTPYNMHKYKQEPQQRTTGAKPQGCCASKTCVDSEHRTYTTLVSEVAQTSDHSLDLEKETIRGYPLFMKIVRADKN